MESAYAASQHRYIGHSEPTVQPIPTTTTTDPTIEMVCFITAGQSPCYPVGSPEAEAAAIKEAEYNDLRFPTTTTAERADETTVSGMSMAERSAPEPATLETVAVSDQIPAHHPVVLPATGLDGTMIAVACIATMLGVVARGITLHRRQPTETTRCRRSQRIPSSQQPRRS